MDRLEREPNRQFDNCNWTLKYGERQELIFYGMQEQIKPELLRRRSTILIYVNYLGSLGDTRVILRA